VNDWLPFLTELSRQLEKALGERIADLTEVKKVLQCVSEAMKTMDLPKSANEPLRPLRIHLRSLR
jgi:hypothetical protein